MSHSTVLVIGENPEDQLAPFIEQLERDEDKQYFVFEDKTEEWRNDYESGADRHGNKHCETYSSFKEYLADWHGVEGSENGRYGYWHNPNAKWDWYQLGGRWTGLLKLKPEASHAARLGDKGFMVEEEVPDGYADQCYLEDLDVLGMRMQAKSRAFKEYNAFETATKGLDVPKTWDEVREEFGEDGIKEARAFWSLIPWVKALREARLDPFMTDTHDYYCIGKGGRDEFVRRAMNSAFSTFAVLKDGKWYERGGMGWFGLVADEKDGDQWQEEFNKLIADLPGDTLISVYDVHI